jgi:hypothetical protein
MQPIDFNLRLKATDPASYIEQVNNCCCMGLEKFIKKLRFYTIQIVCVVIFLNDDN